MNLLQTSALISRVKVATALLLSLACTPLMAQTNHYSALTQANQPQFVARLETPSAPDQGSLLGRTPAATMEYRIVSDRINNRRFFKLIADAIAVNSDAKTLAKNATYISRSRGAVPVELQPNDAISFAFDGKNTVVMSLNGVQLASYQSADFFRMLLATWVGEVPISSRFKREILGKETAPKDIAELFAASAPSIERKQAVAQVLATPAPDQTAPATTSAATAVAATAAVTSAPAPKVVAAPTPQPKVTKAPAPVSSPATAKPEPKPEPMVAAAPVAKAPVKTPEAKPSTAPVAKTESPISKPPVTVAAAKPAAVELSEEEEARRLLLRQEYLKGLNREINIQKHLPPAAFTRRAEGSVRLAIALDKNGKLLKVEVVEPSRYSMFNDQALEAVQNAQPFTPPPSDLESNPFEFETTLYYDLPL